MSIGITPEDMSGMLRREIERRLDEIISKEIEAAKDRAEKSIRDELGRIALAVLAEYDVQRGADCVMIRVKNQRG
jgi:hypothetical protein